MRSRTGTLVAAASTVIVLAAVSTVALAAAGTGFRHRSRAPSGQCSAPGLAGEVVDVTLTNMGGGAMMRGSVGGMMRVLVNRHQVAAGTVSLRVANTGSLVHELVVMPLAPDQQVGDRSVGADNRVDETGSVGEASHTCAASGGDGIEPGALGWATLDLPAGRYELLCNLTGHYAGGMYTELTVS